MRYLVLLHNDSAFRLSEMPYRRSSALDALDKSSLLTGLGRFYSQRMIEELTFGFSSSHAIAGQNFEMHLSQHARLADRYYQKDRLRYVADLIGYSAFDSRFGAYFNFQFDSDGMRDSDYHGTRPWKDVSGDMRAAYFKYGAEYWSVLLGREYVHWGPGLTGSLLTSGMAPSLDMLKFDLDIWKLHFQGFNALLGRVTRDEQSQQVNRYFSGHRLSLRLPRFEAGVHETVMYGGPNEVLNGAYANPLLPYYFADVMINEEKQPSNVTLAMDASYFVLPTLRIYGQFLVDEYYYEGEDYPNQTAWLAGLDWARAYGSDRIWLTGEYARVSRWVYNYRYSSPWNRLIYYDAILGYPLGADMDRWYLVHTIHPAHDLLWRAVFDYSRRGETTITTPLATENEYQNDHPPFPFGIVAKQVSIYHELEYFPKASVTFSAALGYHFFENAGHQNDIKTGEWSILLQFRYRWRKVW